MFYFQICYKRQYKNMLLKLCKSEYIRCEYFKQQHTNTLHSYLYRSCFWGSFNGCFWRGCAFWMRQCRIHSVALEQKQVKIQLKCGRKM